MKITFLGLQLIVRLEKTGNLLPLEIKNPPITLKGWELALNCAQNNGVYPPNLESVVDALKSGETTFQKIGISSDQLARLYETNFDRHHDCDELTRFDVNAVDINRYVKFMDSLRNLKSQENSTANVIPLRRAV